MKPTLENIHTKDDVLSLLDYSRSADGEGLHVEFKSTAATGELNRDTKKNLSKEIVAFSNTYGGLVCFHTGSDTNPESFEQQIARRNIGKIESWLADAIEPPVRGIALKEVGGFILIDVPASDAKPHRCKSTRDYFYRNNSSSVPMPEVMISALYRATNLLNPVVNLSVENANQLRVHYSIKNNSRVVGTKPQVNISIWGTQNKSSLIKVRCDGHEEGGRSSALNHHWDGIFSQGVFKTSNSFRDELLYPDDWFTQGMFFVAKTITHVNENVFAHFWGNTSLVFQVRVNFAECPAVEKFILYDVREPAQLTEIASGQLSQVFADISERFQVRGTE